MHKLHSLLTRQLLFPLFVILLLVSTSFTPLQAFAATHAVKPWMDPSLSPDKRADLLLAQMTLDEKITMLHGTSLGLGLGGYVGHIPANTRLGIPALNLEDGAAGVAGGMTGVTAFPAPVAGAASWDTSLMNQYGQALATEMSGKGANIALSPTVNILRVPQWGRSFESFGEDPYLNSQLGVTEIEGIQSQHIIATVKHLAANNQEIDRMSVSAQVDERTLQEIYLPAFHAAVQQGGVGAVMCSYNKVNTIYACEQPYLLHDALDTQWNFPGFVMSDWYATHSATEAANAGLDMEMPLGLFYDLPLRVAIGLGQVSMTTINAMVHRILRTMFAFGLFDYPTTGSPDNNVASSAHAQFALQEAEQGTVLLKNDQNILPLDGSKIKSIAVIGADASTSPMIVGGGSASVKAPYVVTPLQGIQKRVGSSISVQYASGSDQKQTVQVASSADVAIVFVNDVEAEGSDRSSLSLPNNQDQLVQTVSQANPHTIVVLNTGAPVLMPWVDQVPGIVEAWYPGQEDGNAIAAILFGDVNPSGKLPMTFPKQASDVPANTTQQYPGVNGKAVYSEGVFVGYRYYDANHITPLFPFGHGLAYTTFSYSNLSVTPASSQGGTISVSLDVTNTGSRDGSEVVQLYCGIPSTNMPEPPKQLKGFQKVFLSAGQTRRVTFSLDPSVLAYWDVNSHGWVVQKGTYQIMVGSSSSDIRLTSNLTE